MPINTEIAGISIGDSHHVRIMGIINLSPESFYAESVFIRKEEILRKAREMIAQGCDFLDIGGRSTAPGVMPISVETEKERVLPVLKALLSEVSIPISIDTQYAKVAEKALQLGCQIINDVSGLTTDPSLVKILKEYDSSLIIMATEKIPGDRLTIREISIALSNSISFAITHGIDSKKIIIDPGIGKWVNTKLYSYNLTIINQLYELRKLQKPILTGISRKSFIGDILQKPNPADRLVGSLAATAIAVYNGAHVIRTHDVEYTYDIVRISEALRDAANKSE
ncbi:MAG TPA: dihydropteroate synthase [Candidatus Deferrimicrobium sp.]|nr:dihydropteroate synthase [Candidatus Deferrimicrobium sp.]